MDGGGSSPPARTLLDLAATLTRHQLEAAITEAEINRLGSPTSLAHVAELDSYGIHTTRRNFEEDRARDRALTVEGWRVVRITWRQLHDRRPTLAAELGALLAQPPTQHSRNRRTGR